MSSDVNVCNVCMADIVRCICIRGAVHDDRQYAGGTDAATNTTSPIMEVHRTGGRHPGTPIGGEHVYTARRGPRSTPRRVWRGSDSSQPPMDSSLPEVPALPCHDIQTKTLQTTYLWPRQFPHRYQTLRNLYSHLAFQRAARIQCSPSEHKASAWTPSMKQWNRLGVVGDVVATKIEDWPHRNPPVQLTSPLMHCVAPFAAHMPAMALQEV